MNLVITVNLQRNDVICGSTAYLCHNAIIIYFADSLSICSFLCFSVAGVSYHGQNVLLHLIRSNKRVLSAFDNSGCACCEEGNMKCAGSASNAGVFTLEIGETLWIELPDQHGLHNAPFHNYASFYGYMLYPLFGVH